MSASFELNAQIRQDLGKGASRRLRHKDQLPGILYGGSKPPVALTFRHDDVLHALENEAFYSHILTIHVDGKAEQAIMKAIQRHPYKPKLNHIDLLRVEAGHELHTHVPLHFINEDKAAGVKKGGQIAHLSVEIEVACLPSDLPEFIEVDVLNLDVGASIHLSELNLPQGVRSIELAKGPEHDIAVVTIRPPRGGVEAEEGASA